MDGVASAASRESGEDGDYHAYPRPSPDGAAVNLDSSAYPSRRSVVLSAGGMVATSQPLAAQAGLAVLRAGGSAVDAALATAITLTVVEPTSNGIGSDAFAIVWDGERLHGLNASGPAPRALSAEVLRAAGHTGFPERGWAAVSVPGAPDAWGVLHARFGRVPFDALFTAAIRYAEDGFPVSPVVSQLWRRAGPVFLGTGDAALDEWARVFACAGRTPAAGELWRSPGHAATLRRLASEGPRDFYEGMLAERIVEHARATGGLVDGDDLAGFRSEWVAPISVAYRDHEVWEIPPNGQGIAALQALGIVEGTTMHDAPYASAESWHWQIEAMKLAFADAYRYVADPRRAEVPVVGMLDAGYLAVRWALLREHAQSFGPGQPPGGGTVYLCAADRDGMMVSYIQSNYMGFGSGVVVPDTGIAFQNRAAGFTLEPGHRNEAAGGKRPRHTIIPGFLTRGGAPVGPFGVMGGEMQPQGHLQVVTSMVDYGLDPQSALDAPRWRVTPEEVVLEPEVAAEVVDGLRRRGHRVAIAPDRLDFGRGQIIRRLDSGVYAGGTEPRADGEVAAW